MRPERIRIGDEPDDVIERVPGNGAPPINDDIPDGRLVRRAGGEFARRWDDACMILRRARDEVRRKHGAIVARSAEQEVFGR